MIRRVLLLALSFLLLVTIPVYGLGGSIVIKTDNSGYSSYDENNPLWDQDGTISITTGKSGYYSANPGGYSGMQQTGFDATDGGDSLTQYQEFYSFDQGPQPRGPVQFDINQGKPTYLIVNGQYQPYDPGYVPLNSFWIQGTKSWTQYMKCPLNARFKLLAFSQGGPTTVVEQYSNGRQTVDNYNFYPGYTQGFFWADALGRHTITFYTYGQKSNPVVVDVVPYSGPSIITNPPSGQTSTKTVIISVGTTGQGAGQPQGKGCDITGTWNFGTNGPYNIIYADGRTEAKNTLDGEIFDSGTWNVIDASKRLYGFTWQSGWAHTFTLSADCSSLDGYGKLNGGTEQPCHGTRVTSSESGAYSSTSTGNVGQSLGQPTSSDPFSGSGKILVDSADQGFDPNAGPILSDSQEQGFMSDVQQGEPI